MYVFKIPKSGYSYNSPDHKMILHSGFPLLKLKQSGTGTLVKPEGDSEKIVEISHGLGYVPICFVFGKYLDENQYPDVSVVDRYKYFSFTTTPGLHLWQRYGFYADTNNLYIFFTTNAYISKQVSLPYSYYIFYDEEA